MAAGASFAHVAPMNLASLNLVDLLLVAVMAASLWGGWRRG